MDMSYRFLNESDFHEIYRTFLEAFSDYALNMRYMNETVLYNRAVKNGVDFNSSIGAFSAERMVGFTLVGIDDWQGKRSAFDIATGIVNEFRGRGVARRMFESIRPKLKEHGVVQFFLEVLQENEPAVDTYTKTGFRVTREFDCFQLAVDKANLHAAAGADIEIRESGKDIGHFQSFYDWLPSWENSFASIQRIPDDMHIFAANMEDDPAGVLVYYPGLNWIMSLAVDPVYRRKGIATRLLRHLFKTVPMPSQTVKLINVQRDDYNMIAFLKKIGFAIYASQYEMVLEL